MKLLASIRRELVLLSRSIYFYVEIAVAVVFLAVLLFVLPEQFDTRATEYTIIDLPQEQAAAMEEALFTGMGVVTVEDVTLKSRGQEVPARLYTSDLKYVYVLQSREALVALCEDTGRVGTVVHAPGDRPAYEYYMQGNEAERYKGYTELILSSDYGALLDVAERQSVRALERNPRVLSDRQSVLPLMLTVNCVLMGILVTAGYIIEDKKTRVINALRVLPARIGAYLTAKMAAVTLTSLCTCLIITVPVMKGGANYLLLTLIVVCGGFFTVSIGALLAGFFEDMGKAFASVYAVLIVLLVPALLDMMPGLGGGLERFIPSYYVVESVKGALLGRDLGFVVRCCAGFAAGGLVLMPVSARRYIAAGTGG